MNTAQFTPGPWSLDGHNLSSVIHCTVPKGHPDAKHVCGDYEQIASAHGDNWAANAHLIAAAPDLLVALKSFMNNSSVVRGLPHTARAAAAAIAKAEGR